ncbi:ArnT family glycosyltransferase [Caulobacter sp. KR2-114]|uniref:ArnT family glycosyltransferase n=1 Tax=Caulobacter sp. KR2-114 TaxID=3400912 RepID=UPI003C125465
MAAFVAVLAGLPGLFLTPTIDRDEPRFAEATAQMLETGDFVSIQFQDLPRFKKPVGVYWLQAASVKLLSHAEDREIWAYRLPSLLGAALAAAACAWGASAFLSPGLATIAGVALGTGFVFSTEAFLATTDGVLAGAITLAMAALGRLYLAETGGPRAGRRTRAWFWLGLAVSILVKGPVGPLIVGLTLLTLGVWDRKARWMRHLGWGWGLILIAALVGPWAMAITVATDGAFWGAAVGGDLAPKLAGGQEGHGAPPLTYALLASLLIFPATLLLPAGLSGGWRNRAEPGVRFAIAWAVPAWIVFELIPTKLPHYPLPLFGALAWLMARALAEPIGRLSRLAGAGLAALAAVAFAAVSLAAPIWLKVPGAWPAAAASALAFLAAGGVGAWLLLRQNAGRGLVIASGLGLVAHTVFWAALAPALTPLWPSSDTMIALRRAGLDPRNGMTPGPITLAGYQEPSLIFALGTATELGDGQTAADAIADGRPVVVEGRQQDAFVAALRANGDAAQMVGAVHGFDYSNGRPVALRLFKPALENAPPAPTSAPGQ